MEELMEVLEETTIKTCHEDPNQLCDIALCVNVNCPSFNESIDSFIDKITASEEEIINSSFV
jgi:hypothetical protein